jgi:CheY-like chemotaxis protein
MAEKRTLLTVGTNRANLDLMGQQFQKEGYETVRAASLEELDQAVEVPGEISAALVDLSGFDRQIWDRCEELRKRKIPFLVISPQRSPTIQRDSMRHGASGLLTKPVGVKDLLGFIKTLLGD